MMLGRFDELLKSRYAENLDALEDLTSEYGAASTNTALKNLVENFFGNTKQARFNNVAIVFSFGFLFLLLYWAFSTDFFLANFLFGSESISFNQEYILRYIQENFANQIKEEIDATKIGLLSTYLFDISFALLCLLIMIFVLKTFVTLMFFRISIEIASKEIGIFLKCIMAILLHFAHLIIVVLILYLACLGLSNIYKNDTYEKLNLLSDGGNLYIEYGLGANYDFIGPWQLFFGPSLGSSYPIEFPYGSSENLKKVYTTRYIARKQSKDSSLYDSLGYGFGLRVKQKIEELEQFKEEYEAKGYEVSTSLHSTRNNEAFNRFCEVRFELSDRKQCVTAVKSALNQYKETKYFKDNQFNTIRDLLIGWVTINPIGECILIPKWIDNLSFESNLFSDSESQLNLIKLVKSGFTSMLLAVSPLLLTYLYNVFILLFCLVSLVILNVVRRYSIQNEEVYHLFSRHSSLIMSSSFILTISLIGTFILSGC